MGNEIINNLDEKKDGKQIYNKEFQDENTNNSEKNIVIDKDICTDHEFNKDSSVNNSVSKKKTKTNSKAKVKGKLATIYITKIAILAAFSVVLYLFARFPIFPMFPYNVLEMDFSSIPSLLGGFALGPVAGVLIELIKCSIKLSTSSTLFVGELSNFIVSTAFVLPATLIYKYNKSMKGAIIGLTIGVFSSVVIASISNYFLIIPLYSKAFKMPALMEEFRVLFSFGYGIAFNLIKTISVSILTFLLYKRVSKPLHL